MSGRSQVWEFSVKEEQRGERRELIFVYGTLKRGFYNHHYLENEKFLGEAMTLYKYALYRNRIPFLQQSPPVSNVYGEVYEVSSETLKVIDVLEGHPLFYRRLKAPVVLLDSGERVDAWIYFFPLPITEVMGRLVVEGVYV